MAKEIKVKGIKPEAIPDDAYICPLCGEKESSWIPQAKVVDNYSIDKFARQCVVPMEPFSLVIAATFICSKCKTIWAWRPDKANAEETPQERPKQPEKPKTFLERLIRALQGETRCQN